MEKSPLNSRLREARLEHAWSQKELAGQVGTTSVNVSRWENGSHFPSPYYRQKLSDVLGKTLAELDLLSSSPPPPIVLPKPPELILLPSRPISRIANIPITRNPYFTGRQQLLESLHNRLSTAKMAALTQAQALYGLGGVGKTQTVAEYAFRYGDDYTHVFWVLAASHDTLIADFVKLAELLDVPEKDEQDQQRIVTTVKRWLATHEGWLLILDNADDLRLAHEFLPPNHKGYVLFTTRAQASGAIAASIEVKQLGLYEGTLLLLRWVKRLDMDTPLDQAQPADRAAAECIVKEMDGLPLAIVQAGAYIEETGCSLEDYLSLYAAHCKDLLSQRSGLLLDYPETVATTWTLSFAQVKQESAAAADLFCLCSFLAPDAIPEELLTRGTSESGLILGAAMLKAVIEMRSLFVSEQSAFVRKYLGPNIPIRLHNVNT